MSIFQEAKMESAYLKAGLFGDPATGKTRTATEIAIGLHKYIESKKPVYFLDTENGSDFVLDLFKKAEIPLMTSKTRAFQLLLEGTRTAEENGDILIIDSISHFWNEVMEAYLKERNIPRMKIHHWLELKPVWRQFTDLYVKSALHIILCGRVSVKFGYEEDEEGIKELVQTETKMQVEKDIGYEPNLLIEMVQIQKLSGKSYKVGSPTIHRAWIRKDKFPNGLDGKCFDNPTFTDFLPHVMRLNLGGVHTTIEKGDSQDMFIKGDNAVDWAKKKDILLENIADEFVLKFPGMTIDMKQKRIEVSREIFGTGSWTEISKDLKIEQLAEGLQKLKEKEVSE